MTTTTTGDADDYQRGRAAGRIDEQLRQHAEHFKEINGSIGILADRMATLATQMQRIADAAEADRVTAISTAAALAAADVARRHSATAPREAADRRWSPLTRVGLVIGALAGLAAVLALMLQITHAP